MTISRWRNRSATPLSKFTLDRQTIHHFRNTRNPPYCGKYQSVRTGGSINIIGTGTLSSLPPISRSTLSPYFFGFIFEANHLRVSMRSLLRCTCSECRQLYPTKHQPLNQLEPRARARIGRETLHILH